ncbi:MAG: hypothetical protein QME68_08105, partial [Elusimicrobiota bacterium]|nr:hypothetical protein [Elusimicrobiota bacterium]
TISNATVIEAGLAGSGFNASSTPFWGSIPSEFKSYTTLENFTAEIKKIFFIVGKNGMNLQERGSRKLTYEEALRKLLQNIMFFIKEKKFIQQLLNIAEKFCLSVPAYELSR